MKQLNLTLPAILWPQPTTEGFTSTSLRKHNHLHVRVFSDIPPNSETLQSRIICISGQPLLDLWLITKEKKILVNILHETSADNIMTRMMMTIRRTGRPFQPRVRSDIMSSWQSPQKMDKELCIAALTMYQSSQATAFVPEALTATMYKAPAWCVLSLTISKRWDDMTQTCVSSAIRKDIGLQTTLAGTKLRDMQLLWLSWWLQ